MSDVIPLTPPTSKKNRWNRTLPGTLNDDSIWIVAVLEDLSAFAAEYCSHEIQSKLNTTTHEVRRLILTSSPSV